MTATAAPSTWQISNQVPHTLRQSWTSLIKDAKPGILFDPAMVTHLPVPAQRWLQHAITPGTQLRTTVELRQHGTIKLMSWRPFTAIQVLAPLQGYIWAEKTSLFCLPVTGFDRLTDSTAEMRHSLFGHIPLVNESGPDLFRSAVGRLVSELVFVPAAALDPSVSWKPVDEQTVIAVVAHAGQTHDVQLTVKPSGALASVTLSRWAKIGKQPFQAHPFTAVFDEEGCFDGYTIPTKTTAGYGYNPDSNPTAAFITQTIDNAVFY